MFASHSNRKIAFRAPVPRRRLRLSATLATLLIAALILTPRASADQPGWDYKPYKIHAIVTLDLPGGLAQHMNNQLPPYLERRVDAAIGLLWMFNMELATGPARNRILAQIATPLETPTADFPIDDADKLVLIAVRWQPDGYTLSAREFDTYIQRWGTPIRRKTRQEESLPEQVFAILCQAVAPLALFELDPADENRVLLQPRGAALMRRAAEEPWTKPGDVFLPVLRRTSRGGQLVENGILVVPWTYLDVVENNNEKTSAQIQSGTRRPFGARRQGRTEQVAIALRSDPAETTVRLHSRTERGNPLIGYEVLSQTDPTKRDAFVRIGSTDRQGKVTVPPGKNRVRVIFVKNGGNLLVRLPIVPGDRQQVDVPLPNDDARLQAEAILSSMREDLIDVVARRNILMARARQKIKDKDFTAAQKLLTAIDELPGRSQFNLELTASARRVRSDDPQIQRRIDRLFEGTQTALTQHLDVRQISELHNELRAAQQKGS